MPVQVQQTASNLKSIHLLRALLRETTYLPDSSAREYFRRYIVHRFRAYQPTQNATASAAVQAVERYRHRSFKRRHISIIHERTRATQRKAQKGLNFLRRANQGEQSCLEKILLFTYGRMGRRKYALLNELLKPDPLIKSDEGLVTPEEDPPLQKLYHSNKRYLSFFDAPKKVSDTHYKIEISKHYARLRTVVKSQYQNGISTNRELRKPYISTPVHTVWHRPMPIKRARNNVRRWYAETMTRLLPPLPSEEWDTIQAMVNGQKWISFTKRRTPAIELNSEPVQDEVRFKELVDEAIVLEKPSKADKPWGIQRPHTITARYMRRLYIKVLALCCKLEWDDSRNKWNAIWGTPRKCISPQIYSAPVEDSLFRGVDAKGQLIREPEPRSKPRSQKERRPHVQIPFFAEYLSASHPLRKHLEEIRKRRDAQSATAGGDLGT